MPEDGSAPDGTRLVWVQGRPELAWNFTTRSDGTPVAIIGPPAVQCPLCLSYQGKQCQTPDETPLPMPHLERSVEYKRGLKLLLEEHEGHE